MDQPNNGSIKIICPVCSAPLNLKKRPSKPDINVKCPICGNSAPFSRYRTPKVTVDAQQGGPHTQLPTDMLESTQTHVGGGPAAIGYLQIAGYSDKFPLKEGPNVLGRFSPKSNADIKLPSPNNRMSRDHMVVEVNRQPNGAYIYFAYLCKEKVNRTYVDTMMLYFGDKVLLHNGSVLRLPECEVRLVIPEK